MADGLGRGGWGSRSVLATVKMAMRTAGAVGAIINPVAHQGQLSGGFAFGIGAALMEDMRSEEGRISTLNLADYKLPTQADMPLRTVLLRSHDGPGPFGAQAAGEVTNITVAPAIANAVAAAVGVRSTMFPITAERVLSSLRLRDGRESLE